MTMLLCANCMHKGEDHDWRTPPCSLKGEKRHHCHRDHPRRRRGRCLIECDCSGYKPLTNRKKPTNHLLRLIIDKDSS